MERRHHTTWPQHAAETVRQSHGAALATAGSLSDAACRAALDALQGYLLVANADRRIQFMSKAPPGFGLQRFIGADFIELVAEAQRPLVHEAADRILAGAPAVELEVQGTDTGRWHSMRMVGIKAQGVVSGFSVHSLDVDDAKRKDTETAILRSRYHSQLRAASVSEAAGADDVQRRFDLMADALPVLISYVDRERRYQHNNSAYERWFGESREELRGRVVEDVLGTAAYEGIRPYVDAALQGRAVTFGMAVPYKGAGLRQVVAHYVPDFASNGEILGFYALIEDVTTARETEAALRQREDEMRQLQKMEALGRLAGGMAHEFNNLLHVVITSCDAILPSLAESPAAAQIAQIERAAERGASLTRQLLSFSRSSDVRTEALDLDALLADMQILVDRLLGPRITLDVALDARCRIRADGGQIQQIVMNLAINARDAMPRGGRLRLATARTEVAAEEADRRPALKPGDCALLTVTDTGAGMDAETLARIFDPFFTTKPPDRGTGLGLSTVYGIVQQLGGHIEVDSEVDRGTTFKLYFPCLDESRS
jgi:PAS domain S-box-containing protein